MRSDDAGRTWAEVNAGLRHQHLFALTQERSTGQLYAGSEPAALFTSDDSGESWREIRGMTQLSDTIFWTFPRQPHIAHVKHIDVSPAAPGRILASIEEGWIVRSEDSGKSWTNVKDNVAFDNHTVYTMPDDPDIVLSSSGAGISRSVDGGRTFEHSGGDLTHAYFAHLVFHEKNPQVILTAAAEVPPPLWRERPSGANAGFFRSEDQGRTWSRLTGGLPDLIRAAPRATAGDHDDPDAFYAGFNDGSVWMTSNGGESFDQILTGLGLVSSVAVVHQ